MGEVVRRAHGYRCYPSSEQADQLNRTVGCVRLVYNRALDARTRARAADRRRDHLHKLTTRLVRDTNGRDRTLPICRCGFSFVPRIAEGAAGYCAGSSGRRKLEECSCVPDQQHGWPRRRHWPRRSRSVGPAASRSTPTSRRPPRRSTATSASSSTS
ncbi:helix-turn-helix domain-containing protein [Micromonospora sp. NPDC050686]|uniref:helix-turn-helix domain-containing protein n=1 Tax=Micromonospora sp. NPDC050686 TaxID=3154631 RepID=UPI0034097B24